MEQKKNLKIIAKITGGMLFFLYLYALLFYTFFPSFFLFVPYSLVPTISCAEGYESHCPRIIAVHFLYYTIILVIFSTIVAFKKPRTGGILLFMNLLFFFFLQFFLAFEENLALWDRFGPLTILFPWEIGKFLILFGVSIFSAATLPLFIVALLFFLAGKKNISKKIPFWRKTFHFSLYTAGFGSGLCIVVDLLHFIDCYWKLHYYPAYYCFSTPEPLHFLSYLPLVVIILGYISLKKLFPQSKLSKTLLE